MNDAIPEDVRLDLDELKGIFFESIEASDFDKFYQIGRVPPDQKEKDVLKSIFYQLNLVFEDKVFKPKDEFYLTDVKGNQNAILSGDKNTDYAYRLEIELDKGNSFFSLLTSTDSMVMVMLTFNHTA